LLSGAIQSGHNYVIVQESADVNLLERVYTHLNIGLTNNQPIYLYVKTLLGENTLDLSQTNLHGLRLHGGILSLDVSL
jgi:hypothetical protein